MCNKEDNAMTETLSRKLMLPALLPDAADPGNPVASEPSTPCSPHEYGDLPFAIRRDGTWMYRGCPIKRKELVCLLVSLLKRDEDGHFWLETPSGRGRILVEDAPFVAVELIWGGCGRSQQLSFRTNVDLIVTAGPEHPIRLSHDLLTCEPTPYIQIRPGAGRWPIEARIARPLYYELLALAEPHVVDDGRKLSGVWSCGRFFALGEISND